MHAIDQIYTDCPFYGSRRTKDALRDDYDSIVGRDHVRRLMKVMGLEAVYPKKATSIPDDNHRIYPYLLRNLTIIRPNQVWGTDITYIRLAHGFCYLTAIIDWFSRYVIAFELSKSMEVEFCLQALSQALTVATPEIHNSDQGSQFTAQEYLSLLQQYPKLQISMDGRGRCMDNIFTERLWRSVKYENVYLKQYQTIDEARAGLTEYFEFYNTRRRHQGINNQTPQTVYYG
jgi:putative transposase